MVAWPGLGPRVPFRIKQINTKVFCAITFIPWWNIPMLMGGIPSRMTNSSPVGQKKSVSEFDGPENSVNCLLWPTKSSDLNTYRTVWTDHETTASEGMLFFPPLVIWRLLESVPRCFEGVAVAHSDLVSYLDYIQFSPPLICHSSMCASALV